MREIREAPRDGDDVWRDGWKAGYEQAVRDQEHAKDDGPRTWQIEYPPAPPAGTRVRTRNGQVYTLDERGLIDLGTTVYTWEYVLETYGPLTEVVETEVEAAARRLRERGLTADIGGVIVDSHLDRDVRIVLAHVLNGGTL